MEESFDQICWDGLDCCITEDVGSDFFPWSFPSQSATKHTSCISDGPKLQGLKRPREQKVQTSANSKACREKQRREKLNDMFLEMTSFLHPERPERTDKSAILTDAINAVTNLRAEAQELKHMKTKLQNEVKTLKAEKAELHEDKLQLKANKLKMERQLKASASTIIPNKLMGYPNYVGFPMWHWISPSVLDTSKDHAMRPPVA